MGRFGKPSRAHPVQLAIIRQPPLARTNLDKSDASYKLTFGFSGLAYHLEVSILGGSPRLKRGASISSTRPIRFHLSTLYCDQRGINLRNQLAHGLADVGMLHMGVANWVVHSVLLLGCLRLGAK